jgi:hypothetical protein
MTACENFDSPAILPTVDDFWLILIDVYRRPVLAVIDNNFRPTTFASFMQ